MDADLAPSAARGAACGECGAVIEGGTAACNALMFDMTAASPDARRLIVRRTFVDAYSLQHPEGRCATPHDVAAHLLSLCCAIECNGSLDIYSGMKVWLRRATRIQHLEAPAHRGSLTILDAAAAEGLDDHIEVVRRWGHSVWDAWQRHHETVRAWVDEIRASR